MSARWSSSSSSSSAMAGSSSISQGLLLLEKKRKAKEDAARDIKNALLEETLARMRGKAHELQNDTWMYQDVQL